MLNNTIFTKTLNWLYLDINSYFATIEQQIDKSIRNKPVAVVPLESDYTCAIAASYEAKAFGVSTGTKIADAKKLCPELICIKAKHKLYVEYHKLIFAAIDKIIQVDHIFSIDEGACKLTGQLKDFNNTQNIALRIKGAIKTVGDYITCSIGIAPNRYLAKIASNMHKPDGVTTIAYDDITNVLSTLSLRALPSIGARTCQKLEDYGLKSPLDIYNANPMYIKHILGLNGERIWYLLHGSDIPLEESANKTISNSQVIAPKLQDINNTRIILTSLVIKATYKLRQKGKVANISKLHILTNSKLNDLSVKFDETSDTQTILSEVLKQYDFFVKKHYVTKRKKISISFPKLKDPSSQMSFGVNSQSIKRSKISKVMDYINDKYGENTILLGLAPKDNKKESVTAFGYIAKHLSNN